MRKAACALRLAFEGLLVFLKILVQMLVCHIAQRRGEWQAMTPDAWKIYLCDDESILAHDAEAYLVCNDA